MVNMKQLHTFSYGLLPFVLFTVILYAFFYNHHLLFAEQLRLFEWNKDYFNEIVYNPGGLSAYIGEFFTQFYHLNHFGGWILGAGVGLTGILYRNLICHWKIGGNVSWELIPITSLVFFYLNPNASLGLIFGLLITLLLARITLHEKEGKRKRLLILINLPICYFFTGIGCYLYLILIFLDEVFSKKKHSLLAWILYTLVTILLPILTYYKFDINETQAWIGIACFITQDLLHPLGIVITSFLISPLLAYGTYHLLQRLTDKKRFALNLLMAFFAIGIILSQLTTLSTTLSNHPRKMGRSDYLHAKKACPKCSDVLLYQHCPASSATSFKRAILVFPSSSCQRILVFQPSIKLSDC